MNNISDNYHNHNYHVILLFTLANTYKHTAHVQSGLNPSYCSICIYIYGITYYCSCTTCTVWSVPSLVSQFRRSPEVCGTSNQCWSQC